MYDTFKLWKQFKKEEEEENIFQHSWSLKIEIKKNTSQNNNITQNNNWIQSKKFVGFDFAT